MAITRVPGVHSDVVDGTSILIGPAGTHVIELNAMGSLVWRAIDGQRELPELVTEVLAAVGPDQVTSDQVGADVAAFVAELTRLDLVRP
jgi:hypothetical protein